VDCLGSITLFHSRLYVMHGLQLAPVVVAQFISLQSVTRSAVQQRLVRNARHAWSRYEGLLAGVRAACYQFELPAQSSVVCSGVGSCNLQYE
jgi:hypothetical protein